MRQHKNVASDCLALRLLCVGFAMSDPEGLVLGQLSLDEITPCIPYGVLKTFPNSPGLIAYSYGGATETSCDNTLFRYLDREYGLPVEESDIWATDTHKWPVSLQPSIEGAGWYEEFQAQAQGHGNIFFAAGEVFSGETVPPVYDSVMASIPDLIARLEAV